MSASLTAARNDAIAAAKDLPSLVTGLEKADPALAANLTPKALAASRTPWGTLAGGIVAWAVSRWGLGWDQTTCDLVAGAGVLVASYIMRAVTAAPITGMLKAGKL